MGRPSSLSGEQRAEAVRLADEGLSLRQIAEQLGTSKDTVSRVVRAARTPSMPPPPSRPVFPNVVTRPVIDEWGRRRMETRRTRTVQVAGRPVEVDAEGQAYCNGCLEWLPLAVATAPGSPHRAVPGVSFVRAGQLRPMPGNGPVVDLSGWGIR